MFRYEGVEDFDTYYFDFRWLTITVLRRCFSLLPRQPARVCRQALPRQTFHSLQRFHHMATYSSPIHGVQV